MGSQPNRREIADRVSPMKYVRADLPPIITIHGNADPTVPYAHAVQLHEALDQVEIRNQLITVPNGRHGGFPAEEMLRIYDEVFKFLDENLPN